MRTGPLRDGDEFVMSGQKFWTSLEHGPTGASSVSTPTESSEAQGHFVLDRGHFTTRDR
jgi:hypothetical protein